MLSSSADSTQNVSFPFVSLPHFETHAGAALSHSDAELIAWIPLVAHNQRAAFEQYAVDKQGWIEEGLVYEGNPIRPGNVSQLIFPWSRSSSSPSDFDAQDFHTPLWQTSKAPTSTSQILLDLYTHPKFSSVIDDVLITKHAMLSDVVDLRFLLETSAQTNSETDHEPRSFILAPVFNHIGKTETETEATPIVGFVLVVLPWRTFFLDELPSGCNGIIVKVQNTCGQEFTYCKCRDTFQSDFVFVSSLNFRIASIHILSLQC
jgi:CHASE domain